MVVCVIPKGSYVYVTNSADEPGNAAVRNFVGMPSEKVPDRVHWMFRSVREVRYPKSDEMLHWNPDIRIFKLPPNQVGKYLVVINNDHDLGVFGAVREEDHEEEI